MQRSFLADSRLIQALQKRAVSSRCQQGQTLFQQGEECRGLYFIKGGEALLVMTAENGTKVLELTVGPGSLLGVPAVVSKGTYTLTATALSGAEVGFVELNEFDALMREQPQLFPLVLAVLADGVRAGRAALAHILSEHSSRLSGTADPPRSA